MRCCRYGAGSGVELQEYRAARLKLTDRKATSDIYCESETGEKLIMELQKAKQNYFKDHTVFYSTFPVQEHLEELQSTPQLFLNEVFMQAFDTATLAQMSADDWEQYEGSLKSCRDTLNVAETTCKEGEEQGVSKVARAMPAVGLPVEAITQITMLTTAEITALNLDDGRL